LFLTAFDDEDFGNLDGDSCIFFALRILPGASTIFFLVFITFWKFWPD
jgi:hypothetical protein